MSAFFYLVLTYLLASIPTGLVLTTLFSQVDITSQGSGNIGATNVYRLAGHRLGALTLAGDLLKGLLPVLLAPLLVDATWFAGVVALAAFAGHCWSAYVSFRGGKGVATAAGALLVLAPVPILLAAACWLGVVLAFKKSSLGALVAAALLQVLVAWLASPVLWVSLLLGAGVVWRHQANIRRLLAGTEG